jgi:hypothetical protein
METMWHRYAASPALSCKEFVHIVLMLFQLLTVCLLLLRLRGTGRSCSHQQALAGIAGLCRTTAGR